MFFIKDLYTCKYMKAINNYLSNFKALNYLKISFFLLSFSFGIIQKLSTILILLTVFFSFLEFYKKKEKPKISFNIILVILFLFLLLNAARDGLDSFTHNAELKASLIAFPIIFSVLNLTLKDIRQALLYFAFGCSFSVLIGFFISIYINFFDPSIISDLKENILHYIKMWHFKVNYHWAYPMDALYYSLYNSIAAIILLTYRRNINSALLFLCVFLCITGIVMVNSFYGYYMFIILIILWVLKKYFQSFYTFQKLLFLVYTLVLSAFPFFINNEMLGKRAVIWEIVINLFNKVPFFGFGELGALNQLNFEYNAQSLTDFNNLSSHNQFFQFFLEGGFLLLALLLIIIYVGFKKMIPFKDSYGFIFLCFLISMFTLFIVECAFNRYTGISFFAYFYCLLMYFSNKFKPTNRFNSF